MDSPRQTTSVACKTNKALDSEHMFLCLPGCSGTPQCVIWIGSLGGKGTLVKPNGVLASLKVCGPLCNSPARKGVRRKISLSCTVFGHYEWQPAGQGPVLTHRLSLELRDGTLGGRWRWGHVFGRWGRWRGCFPLGRCCCKPLKPE